MSIVDTHFHVWDPELRAHAWLAGVPVLNRRFWIDEFESVARDNDVGQAILVQVLNDMDDTRDFLSVAAGHPLVAGVVGWVPLESPDVRERIGLLRNAPGGDHLVAIRHLIQDEPDPGYASRASVIAGVRAVAAAGLAYDVVIRSYQLPAAIELARAVPECRFVLDHGAKPPLLGGEGLEAWERGVADLAGCENVSCKVSGLVTEGGETWRKLDIRRCVSHLLECFGAQRVMFGSDWPVCTAVATYPDVLELCESSLAELSTAERDAVMCGNARRIYQLEADGVR